jgi:transposase
MDKRLLPIELKTFNELILPIIEKSYIWEGRAPTISHYKVFCAILYILRTNIPWRDLPKCYGNWHSIFMRFQRGNEKAIWWKILAHLQKAKKAAINVVICDSSTFKYNRHGGGQKGDHNPNGELSPISRLNYI